MESGNRFTGWWDVDVTEKGSGGSLGSRRVDEGKGHYPRRRLHQRPTRAIKTLNLALEAMGRLWVPVTKNWQLNERHYGGLTGLDKVETAAKHGEDHRLSGVAVSIFRRHHWRPVPPMTCRLTRAMRVSPSRIPKA